MSRRTPWACGVALLALSACGPTILEKRIIEQPDPALLRPTPSPEEQSGEVPMLEDMRPALTLVPADHDAPKAPDDPRPLALKDAPQTAPPLPPPPAAVAPPADAEEAPDDRDDRRDDALDDAEEADDTDDAEDADDEADDVVEDEDDDGPRRGGIRVNPR